MKDVVIIGDGRIRSQRRGPYWLNRGGHIAAGGDSATARLLDKGRVETYPLGMPMSRSSRLAMLTAGAKVSAAVARYARVVQQRPGESRARHCQEVQSLLATDHRTAPKTLSSLRAIG
jgi:oxygen-dependent protoporphyrinogen oxidase